MSVQDDLTAQARERIGSRLKNKWRLDELIGVGGTAAVYRATHRNGKVVAIKVLHARYAADNDARRRFLREGYAANSIAHPAVVQIDDDDVEDGAAFLVMEHLTGRTLDALIRDAGGRIDARVALPLVAQLLELLVVAHGSNVVHRDLKPDNLIVTADGRLRVLDFGLALVRGAQKGDAASTAADTVLGTPHFMAPEQASGRWELVDGRTDLWAVGATLFRMLSGRYVHMGDNVRQVMTHAASEPAPSLSTVQGDAAPELVVLVDRALAFAMADRFDDAGEMLQALVGVADVLGVEIDPETALAEHALVSKHAGPGGVRLAVVVTSLVAVVVLTLLLFVDRANVSSDLPSLQMTSSAQLTDAVSDAVPKAAPITTSRSAARPVVAPSLSRSETAPSFASVKRPPQAFKPIRPTIAHAAAPSSAPSASTSMPAPAVAASVRRDARNPLDRRK